ncbi:MAG: hypothetical protein AB7D03_11565 [Thiomicrospira sp.]
MNFIDYLACDDVRKVTDVTDQFIYDDISNEHRAIDSSLVSCGQDASYNELKYIYDTHLSYYVANGSLTEEQAAKGLCRVCHDYNSPRRDRTRFYRLLSTELGVEIPLPGKRGR